MKKTLKIISIILILIAIAVFFMLQSYKPQYSGEIKLKGLKKEVTVYHDKYGIPHIYAENKDDLYFALGYLHAQERLFQMEMLRRITSGRLSEIIGTKTIETDKYFRTLQINKASELSIKKYFSDKSKPYVKDANNYLRGINDFLMNGKTPIEYQLMGIKKEKFKIVDLFNIAGFMAFSFAEAFKIDPMISKIQNELGNKYLEDIVSSYVPGTERVPLSNNQEIDYSALSKITKTTSELIDNLPVPFFEGSNSWILSQKKTESGGVIFANDTHIGYSQPSVWYEAHLECPNFNLYGNFIAGIPFSLLGHNRNLAWGLTMFENDDVDFYYEELNPNDSTQYKSNNTWKNFKLITETIKVKDSSDVTITVRKTERGSIINDYIKDAGDKPISVFWTFTHIPIETVLAFYELNNSNNIEDVKNAASKISSPGLNIMYGDKLGNIAYWAAGKITKFKDSIFQSDRIQEHEKGDISFYNFKNNPKSVNPSSGFVYSSNNQPDSVNGILYPGYYPSEDRAVRVLEFLKNENKWNVEKTKKMQTDVKSAVMPKTVKEILTNIDISILEKTKNHKKAYDILLKWDGEHQKESKGPVIYNRLLRKILELTMIDELGEEDFDFMTYGHTPERSIPVLLSNNNSVWWNNIKTEKKETRKDIFTAAFDSTIVALNKELGNNTDEWKWENVHTVEYQHFIAKSVKPLRKIFNVGPFNVWGAKQVINQIAYKISKDGKYKSTSGPAMRTIIDFSDVENKSYSIIPTGQSGIFMSKHYSDQAEMYNKGEYRKQMMNKDEIIKESVKLVLKPK